MYYSYFNYYLLNMQFIKKKQSVYWPISLRMMVTKIWIDELERRMIKIRMMIDDGFTLNDFLWGGGVRRL